MFRSKEEKEQAVLWCLDRAPDGLFAIDLERITGIWSGSLYPCLARLKGRGLVRDVAMTGVPPRRYKWERASGNGGESRE